MNAPTGVLWQPNPGPQTVALASTATELLFGGGAGGGKSLFLLMGALRYVEHPTFRGVLFRRTFKELEDSLIQQSWMYYPALGGRYVGHKHFWRFPSGSRISFSHLEHEHDVRQHLSAEYQYIGFDELSSFLESQYRYLFSRARSAHGIPIEIRAATNPEPGWVRDRFAPWVDPRPEYEGPRAKSGEKLWYLTDPQTGADRWVKPHTPGALSRSYVQALLKDNPVLDTNDPLYRARLRALDPVQRARLLEGDWGAVYSPGLMFQRGWFKGVDVFNAKAKRVRWWDRAATEDTGNNDPDWTVGLLYARDDEGVYCVEDVIRMRARPGVVERTILETAASDAKNYPGRVMVALPKDPGAAGVFEVETLIRKLSKYSVRSFAETGPKVVRAGPVSSQCEAGNVRFKRARWNEAFFGELEAFPSSKVKDDQVDALSGAHMAIQAWSPGGTTQVSSSTGLDGGDF